MLDVRMPVMHRLATAMLVCTMSGSISGDGYAQEVTGQELLELCSPPASEAGHELCLGYIIGSYDTSVVRKGLCVPASVTHGQLRDTEVTHGQLRDTVYTFMLKHPERLQEPAPHLIVAGIVEAFPCH